MTDTANTTPHGAISAQEFDRTKKLFMRMMNHNLRSPLASVLSCLRVLETGVVTDPEDIKKLVSGATIRTDDMMHILDDMMALYQTANTDEAWQQDPSDLNAIAAAVAAELKPKSPNPTVTIDIIASPTPALTRANRAWLTILTRNLIENAIRYADPATTVTVTISANSDSLSLSVHDIGLPIADEDMPNIFIEFWRAGSAKLRVDRGTGLGLSIVRTIINSLQGSITAKSDPVNGTSFLATIPSNIT